MELWLTPLFILVAFAVGVWAGSDIKKALVFRKKRMDLVLFNPKPQNEFTDYTIEELESHKKYREREYRQTVHYPALRQGHAESLKKVLQMLDWHYDRDGTREFEAQRARTKAELADFDRKYAEAMRGN